MLIVVLAGIITWELTHHSSADISSLNQSPSPGVLKPVSAQGFDPLGTDPGNENTIQAKYAIDGNPQTAWHALYYIGTPVSGPVFGGLKSGTGLLIDMGSPVRLSSVTVTFGAVRGANVKLRLGNNKTPVPSTLDTFTWLANGTDIGGIYLFRVHSTGGSI